MMYYIELNYRIYMISINHYKTDSFNGNVINGKTAEYTGVLKVGRQVLVEMSIPLLRSGGSSPPPGAKKY